MYSFNTELRCSCGHIPHPKLMRSLLCLAPEQIPCEDHMNSGVDMLLLIGSGKIKGKKNNCAPGVSW